MCVGYGYICGGYGSAKVVMRNTARVCVCAGGFVGGL